MAKMVLWIFYLLTLNMDLLNKNPASKKSFLWRILKKIQNPVRRSVRHTLLFLGFCGLWPQYSCPNDALSSITAPAHPYATGEAVYPALFFEISI